MSKIDVITETIAAGDTFPYTGDGQQLACYSLGGVPNIEISINDGGYIPFKVGDAWNLPHKNIRFRNSNTTSVALVAISAPAPDTYVDNSLKGEVDIFGNVTTIGNPLSTYGGTLTPVGQVFINVSVDTTVSGVAESVPLFSAASNVNGVVIRTLTQIHKTVVTGNSLKDYSYLKTEVGNFYHGYRSGYGAFNLEQEFYYEAGEGLEARVGGSMLVGFIATIDYLA